MLKIKIKRITSLDRESQNYIKKLARQKTEKPLIEASQLSKFRKHRAIVVRDK